MYDRVLGHATDLKNFVKNSYPQKSLGEYCATEFLVPLLEGRGLYMELPLKNKNILGHSFEDQFGISTMINSNIEEPQRKFFTQAHELGHHLLDPDLLRRNVDMNLSSDDPMDFEVDYDAESRANRFAAHLLLPNDVLNVLMLEQVPRKLIKHTQNVSYSTLGYRIENYLVEILQLPRYLANKLSVGFMTAPPGETKRTALTQFWQELSIRKYSNNPTLRVTSAEELAIKYIEHELTANESINGISLNQSSRGTSNPLELRHLSSLIMPTAEYIDTQDDELPFD